MGDSVRLDVLLDPLVVVGCRGTPEGDFLRVVNADFRLIFFCLSGSLNGDDTEASFSTLIIASG